VRVQVRVRAGCEVSRAAAEVDEDGAEEVEAGLGG